MGTLMQGESARHLASSIAKPLQDFAMAMDTASGRQAHGDAIERPLAGNGAPLRLQGQASRL